MAQANSQALVDIGAADCWTAIYQASCPIVVEKRHANAFEQAAARLAAKGPFERRSAGPVGEAVRALGPLPPLLAADILTLARRFAALMNVQEVRLRLEGLVTDACRKIHADYTDVRLITTYSGPGTDYIPAAAGLSEENLRRLSTGDIALFKGRSFAEDHEPCFHRSPQIARSGLRRLVLVIDTPQDEGIALRSSPREMEKTGQGITDGEDALS